MKAIIFVLICGNLLSASFGLPASKTDEVELVPPKTTNTDTDPFGDPGFFGGWESPIGNPFAGFFDSFESLMTRMRQQLDHILKSFPALANGNSTEGIDILSPFPGLDDLGKGNTTSVTKVIDGHKVVINETVLRKENDFGGGFVKVRVVDIQPDSSEVTTDREVTGEENNMENEIPK